jgi:hypothetical protein
MHDEGLVVQRCKTMASVLAPLAAIAGGPVGVVVAAAVGPVNEHSRQRAGPHSAGVMRMCVCCKLTT